MKQRNIGKMINDYRLYVYEEMERRGIPKETIPKVIAKTGFEQALTQYPEEQLHLDPKAAVNEILVVAAQAD